MAYTTSVPQPSWNPATGFIIPTEQEILVGVQDDFNVAFGGNLNPALTTPQGQLATSETAAINDGNTQFLNIINMVDPAYASGRMQDAIGRFYQLARIPAASTVVTANCNGLATTVIPLGAWAQDQGGSIYNALEAGTIPTPAQFTGTMGAICTGTISGTTLTVGSTSAGAVAIGQTISGSGVTPGTTIVSGSGASWVVTPSQSAGPTTLTMSGEVISVSAIASGTIYTGQLLSGSGVPANTYMTGGSGYSWTTNNPLQFTSVPLTSSGIALSFACAATGPIAAPAGFVNAIYQAVPGWDTIYNYAAGAIGNLVESRADFEIRRVASIGANSNGTYDSVLGAVLTVPGVLDAYVLGNPLDVTSGATFTGSISGSTLTVDSTSVIGTIAIGQIVQDGGVNVAQGTYIVSGGGTSWGLNLTYGSPVSHQAMVSAQGGVQLVAHSIYVGAYGGNSTTVAEAIFGKISPGCNFNGSTAVAVQDTQFPYSAPYPTYAISFTRLTPTPVFFNVQMLQNANVPPNAVQLIQQSIINTFTGLTSGVNAARAGATILQSQYYAGLFALGAWVQIAEVQVGLPTANGPSVLMQINQEPTIQASNITVTFNLS